MKNILILILSSLTYGLMGQEASMTASSVFPENPSAKIINDYSSIFTDVEATLIAQKLIAYEESTTRQIVIISIDSITPFTNIQDFATGISNYWGVGEKDKNNGLTIVFSAPLKKIAIATGLGTEKILTDSVCQHLIENTIVPYFKKQEYYQGISKGLDSLIYKWDYHKAPSQLKGKPEVKFK